MLPAVPGSCERVVMKSILAGIAGTLLMIANASAAADEYADTIALFKNAGQSAAMFNRSYGYAVFPTVGKGGLVVGAAHGKGRVYQQGKHIGDTSLTQLSVGLQAGGQAYSEIVFFEDERSFKEFTSESFELGAGVSAVALTASASAKAGTGGTTIAASGKKDSATTLGKYY